MFECKLVEEKVIVEDNDFMSELVEKGFGEKKGKKLLLSLVEAVHLASQERLCVLKSGKKLSKEKFEDAASDLDTQLHKKLVVYSDLRKRGFVVKTGFKFGGHFRVYPRGAKAGEMHTKYVVHIYPEEYECSFTEISRAVRLAHNIRTRYIMAVIDSENDVTYYKIERVKL